MSCIVLYIQKFKDHLLDIGIFDTTPAPAVAHWTTTEPFNVETTCEVPQPAASPKLESVSSDDDYDKITQEDVEEAAEHLAIPSINTKYKNMHL